MEHPADAKKVSMEAETQVLSGGVEVADLELPDPKVTTRRWELWSYYIYYVRPHLTCEELLLTHVSSERSGTAAWGCVVRFPSLRTAGS